MSKPKRLNCLAIRLIETYRKPNPQSAAGIVNTIRPVPNTGWKPIPNFRSSKLPF